MRKPGSQSQKQEPGWWNRQEATTKLVIASLSAITLVLIVAVVLVATLANKNESPVASASSTTLGSVAETSTTATTESEASTTETTESEAATTETTNAAGSSTTVASATKDTADHAADYRAQHPSTESFTNSNWTTLDQAPGSHLGAAVDVTGQVTGNPTIDPDSGYLTWNLTIPAAGGAQLQALCRTNVNLDQTILSSGSWVEVSGIAVGTQATTGTGGTTVYVETVKASTEPVATTTP
jgi:hypothetical protein